jgi:predicted phage terminase large subunit-like protein
VNAVELCCPASGAHSTSKSDELHDFSVCTTWLRRGKDHHLIDVLRVRLDYPALKKRIVAHAGRFEADAVLIEDKGSGTSLIQDLRDEGTLRPIAVVPEGDKILRLQRHSATIEAGHVFLPSTADWLGEFKNELLLFPNSRFDDQVDSLSQYLAWRDDRQTWTAADVITIESPFHRELEAALGPLIPASEIDW